MEDGIEYGFIDMTKLPIFRDMKCTIREDSNFHRQARKAPP